MREDHQCFEQAGLAIVAIGMGAPSRAREFGKQLALPFPLLCDPHRVAYRAYGLLHMSLRREASLHTTVRLARAVLQHGGSREREQPVRQLGGVFIVDPAGVIQYAFRSERASEHPTNDELIRLAACLPRLVPST